MRPIAKLALFSGACGIVGGATALWLGLQHNSQDEFFVAGTQKLDLSYCAMIFGGWFAVVGVAAILLGLVAVATLRALRRYS